MDKKQIGRKARRSGSAFERKVRSKLESDGWIVSRWQNDVDFEKNKLIPAKSRFGLRTCGFPDFIVYRVILPTEKYEIKGVECKSRKYLDKIEKKKVMWLLKNNIFSKIEVFYKGKKRGEIVYEEVK